ncbi:F-box/lrr-repeat protein 14-like [Plakobranchus ocellatus]|uniref:F-box/lrr-repeat protein 14-like n=1 Tax=Plakobranchus ocellatus TaxID=259542 RepID=A0AAV3ZCG1_9GAST|nr:F-box/lrr-repeat protein 14-like [Plakobranchus ocellatus]
MDGLATWLGPGKVSDILAAVKDRALNIKKTNRYCLKTSIMAVIDALPQEIISYILGFLSISDRKEAALVCHKWYAASLHPALLRGVIIKCRPPTNGSFTPVGFVQRKLTHLALGEWDSNMISEDNLVILLSNCSNLLELDLSRCNNLFLSGRLLHKASDCDVLKDSLSNVCSLKLGCLRHMTDVTFKRLVSVMKNLSKISLTSTKMILGSGLYDVNQTSPVMFHFSTFIGFLKERSNQIKTIDVSFTSIHDDALNSLAKIEGLSLTEICLQGCVDISDKGLKALVINQPSLEVLDITGCKDLGSGRTFFSTLVSNLPKLHTLILRKCLRVGMCDVDSLLALPSLTTLDLGEVVNLYDKDLTKGLCGSKPRLTTLRLPFCTDIQDCFITRLCETNYNLVHLDLSSCLKLTDSSVHTITRMLTSLRSLSIRYCSDITDLGLLGYVPDNGLVPHKHYFDHDHEGCNCNRSRESRIFRKPTGMIKEHKTSISKAQTCLETNEKELCMLSDLISLQLLDLSCCIRITDLGVAEAIRFRELRTLNLGGLTKLQDTSVSLVAQHNPSLECVSLRACPAITDQAVKELVKHCPRLSSLDLCQCGTLTDISLVNMESKARRLRNLDISFCSHMTLPGVASLERAVPELKVVFRPHMF